MDGYYKQFEDALKQSCDLIFPDLAPSNIIFAYENGSTPNDTFLCIDIISIDETGIVYTPTLTNEAEELLIRQEYEGLVRFDFTGEDSGALVSELNLALSNVWYWEQIKAKNLSVMRKAKAQRIPEKRETKWVDRWTLDVTFAFAAEVEQKVDVIEHITEFTPDFN